MKCDQHGSERCCITAECKVLWLRAERDRLRAALEEFLACFNCSEWEDEPMVFAAMTAAREALAGAANAPSE